jgi:hypothetical protein
VQLAPRAPEWAEDEVIALLHAVKKHGTNWKLILEDQSFSPQFHSARTRMSLKTKWFKMKNVQGFDFDTHDICEFARLVSTIHGYSVKNNNLPVQRTPKVKESSTKEDSATRKRKVSFTDIEATQHSNESESSKVMVKSQENSKAERKAERKAASKTSKPKKVKEGVKNSQEKATPKTEVDEGSAKDSDCTETKIPKAVKLEDESVPKEETPALTAASISTSKPPARKKRRVLSFSRVEKIVSHRFIGVSCYRFPPN